VESVRVRFAPSPTGNLHLGSARTALFNYLFAKHSDGKFILRIEDTDQQRNKEDSLEGIIIALEWLGLQWDEGPFIQSERLHIYREYVDRLLKSGRAYRCYCTTEELESIRKSQWEKGEALSYDRRCCYLTEEEIRQKEDQGLPYVIRFKVDREGDTVIHDKIRGEVRFPNSAIDDFVIIKSDGMPTYQLAVVVDDAEMGITHVIRGEEHLSNTPKQYQIFKALGCKPPEYAHIPLILAPDRSKLSKRHGAVWVGQFQDDGYLADALVNYLALLGWALDDKTEVFSRDELIKHFSLEGISKNPAIFDYKKLAWFNGVYIRALGIKEFTDLAVPHLIKAGVLTEALTGSARNRLERILELIQVRVQTLTEVPEKVRYFFSDKITYEPKAVRKFFTKEYVLNLFEELIEGFIKLDEFKAESIEQIFHDYQEKSGLKLGDIIQPVRLAVTGDVVSPPMHETLEVLGRAKTCERIKEAAEYIKRAAWDVAGEQ
jgi:glutamyl-tRNA synthetase